METKFYNREKAKQLIDFSLVFDNKTKKCITDLDGIIEYSNKCYVICEAKEFGKEMTLGQRITMTRLVDDLGKVKPSILLICEHTTPPPEDIILRDTIVRKVYYKGEWVHFEKAVTAGEFINKFCKKYGE